MKYEVGLPREDAGSRRIRYRKGSTAASRAFAANHPKPGRIRARERLPGRDFTASRHLRRVEADTRLSVLSCLASRSRLARDLWGFTRIYVRPGDTPYTPSPRSGPLPRSLAHARGTNTTVDPDGPTFLPVRPAIHHRKKCFPPPRVAAPLLWIRSATSRRFVRVVDDDRPIDRSIVSLGWGQNVVKRIPPRPLLSVYSPFGFVPPSRDFCLASLNDSCEWSLGSDGCDWELWWFNLDEVIVWTAIRGSKMKGYEHCR